MNRIFGFIAVGGGIFTLIVQVISLATSAWLIRTGRESVKFSIGLWKTCAEQTTTGVSFCKEHSDLLPEAAEGK